MRSLLARLHDTFKRQALDRELDDEIATSHSAGACGEPLREGARALAHVVRGNAVADAQPSAAPLRRQHDAPRARDEQRPCPARRSLTSILLQSGWSTPINILLGLTGAFLGGAHDQLGTIGTLMFAAPVLILRLTLDLYARSC